MAKAKIYTRTGDRGSSQLFTVGRVPKQHLRLSVYGEIDELNSHIGLALAQGVSAPLDDMLANTQRQLFVLGSQIAVPFPEQAGFDIPALEDEDTRRLEAWIDELDADLPALKNFILPGGCVAAASLHVARTVCRRVERQLNALSSSEEQPLADPVISYINRLSDFLFTAARWENQLQDHPEHSWTGR